MRELLDFIALVCIIVWSVGMIAFGYHFIKNKYFDK